MDSWKITISLAFLGIFCPSVFTESGKGPGLSFHPVPPPISGTENILIWFNSTDLEGVKKIVTKLSDFLAAYKAPTSTTGRVRDVYYCDYNQPPPKGKACNFDIGAFGACNEENYFNYHKSSPCVFLKIENTAGWKPEYYNDSKSLPENMPVFLKQHITEVEKMHRERLNTVWLTCEGLNPVDKENIGPVMYMPQFGFAGYYFQHESTEDYLSPLVALRFERPYRGIIINIECKLWARNIVHDPKTKVGRIEFELLVD